MVGASRGILARQPRHWHSHQISSNTTTLKGLKMIKTSKSITKVSQFGIAVVASLEDNQGNKASLEIESRQNGANPWRYIFTDWNGEVYQLDTKEWLRHGHGIVSSFDLEDLFQIGAIASMVKDRGTNKSQLYRAYYHLTPKEKT
jgi:hypothetical protein